MVNVRADAAPAFASSHPAHDPSAATGAGSTVLLYDGECGVCAASVQFLLAREPSSRRSALRFAPLQGRFGQWVRAQCPQVDGVDSVVWFDATGPGAPRVLVRSDAALAALTHLGGAWHLLARLAVLVPRVLRDIVYDAVARRRLRIAAPACLLPTADSIARFLP